MEEHAFAKSLFFIVLVVAIIGFLTNNPVVVPPLGTADITGSVVVATKGIGNPGDVCSFATNCKSELTCRRPVSDRTLQFYGDVYKCHARRPDGSVCEWDDHCVSGKCDHTTGTCVGQARQQQSLSPSEQVLRLGISCSSSGSDRSNHQYGKMVLLFKKWQIPRGVRTQETGGGVVYFYKDADKIPVEADPLTDADNVDCEGGGCFTFIFSGKKYNLQRQELLPSPPSDQFFSMGYRHDVSESRRSFSRCQHCVNDPSQPNYCFKDGYLH